MGGITPYICVRDSRAALEWYAAAFGATVVGEPYVMEDGAVGHCELRIGDAVVMMSDPFESAGVAPPDPDRGNAVTLHLSVDDCDAAARRVRALGTDLDRGPETTGVGRVAVLHDPFGHRWFLREALPE